MHTQHSIHVWVINACGSIKHASEACVCAMGYDPSYLCVRSRLPPHCLSYSRRTWLTNSWVGLATTGPLHSLIKDSIPKNYPLQSLYQPSQRKTSHSTRICKSPNQVRYTPIHTGSSRIPEDLQHDSPCSQHPIRRYTTNLHKKIVDSVALAQGFSSLRNQPPLLRCPTVPKVHNPFAASPETSSVRPSSLNSPDTNAFDASTPAKKW